jgi:hypothetical protein
MPALVEPWSRWETALLLLDKRNVQLFIDFLTKNSKSKQIRIINDQNSKHKKKPARTVIPANAGIQLFQMVMDSGFRRSDGNWDFLRFRQKGIPNYKFRHEPFKV